MFHYFTYKRNERLFGQSIETPLFFLRFECLFLDTALHPVVILIQTQVPLPKKIIITSSSYLFGTTSFLEQSVSMHDVFLIPELTGIDRLGVLNGLFALTNEKVS
ncbi:hypothetical protein [Xenorhabdus entomophaga]|uniref:hypothetical protein n=1 Tax=Xenorhabdus entomophaga TaxID=3136257 RepID=UPI0030F41BFC